jgi:hypothetical protein
MFLIPPNRILEKEKIENLFVCANPDKKTISIKGRKSKAHKKNSHA